jgi:hypothetical protein
MVKYIFTGSNFTNSVIYTDPGTNTLNINSVQDINLNQIDKILIAYDKKIALVVHYKSISTNSLTNNLSI